MNYTEIIKDAIQTAWKHKALWIFGMFLAFFNQGNFSFRVNYSEHYSYSSPPEELPAGFTFFRQLFSKVFENPIPYLIGFSILGFVIWAVSNFVWAFSQGALIRMVQDAEKQESVSFTDGWRHGKKNAKRLFILALIYAIPLAIIFLPATIISFSMFSRIFHSFGFDFLSGDLYPTEEIAARFENLAPFFIRSTLCLMPIICLGSIAAIILKVMKTISARSCVVEQLDIQTSITRGWAVIRNHLGFILLNLILISILSAAFGFVAALPGLALWIPTARAILHSHWSPITVFTGFLTLLYIFVVNTGIGGTLNAFSSTLWTKLYLAFMTQESSHE